MDVRNMDDKQERPLVIRSAQNGQPNTVKRIAAIDLGTNSFHAIIVDIYSDGSFREVDDLKEMVQLAKGGLGKRLADAAFKRGMTALRNIKVLCDSYGAERILAYATSAIREAENGGEFIQRAIDELDIKINAIPGIMEAELIGYAVQHGVKLGLNPVLIVDIGGGSVEFILANKKEFFFLGSKKIGVSRMADIFKPSDPVSEEDIMKLEAYYEEQLRNVADAFAKHPTETIIGSSGTMQNIALMIAARKNQPVDFINELEFTASDFAKFYKEFIKMDRHARAKVAGLDEKRIDIINTGMVLVNLLIRKFGIKKIKISDQALREGIIIRYLKKEMIGLPWAGEFSDPRRRSVFELLRKCQWHEEHSRHVAKLSLIIFDTLRKELKLTDNDRELLEYAAYLHDIGYYISHSSHHKHALYLIKNAELKGFKEEEVDIMANVARYHRRSIPKQSHVDYWKLNRAIKIRIRKLAGILRVADGLDRSHYQNVQRLSVVSSEKEIVLYIETQSEPYLEIWGSMRKTELLKTVTKKRIRIERVLEGISFD